MNKQPIENARDADLRLSVVAMRRAAQRAREIAEKTGTALVVSRDGVLTRMQPSSSIAAAGVHESSESYTDKQ